MRTLLLLIVSINVTLTSGKALGAPSCSEVLKKTTHPFTDFSSYQLGEAKIQISASERGVIFEAEFPNSLLKSDISLIPVLISTLDISARQIEYTPKKIRAQLKKPLSAYEFQQLRDRFYQSHNWLKAVLENVRPLSLDEQGSFDSPTRLEKYQERVSPGIGPNKFRKRYEEAFAFMLVRLPFALRVAFKTEYFLNENFSQDPRASFLVETSYKVSSNTAQRALTALAKEFEAFLNSGDAPRVDVSRYWLVSHTESLPFKERGPYKPRGDKSPNYGRSKDSVVLAWKDSGYSYSGRLPRNHRRLLVDDLPPEIIDLATIAHLREVDGISTIQELAARYTGPELMYDLGLSRNEIRDLYFYLRDNHNIRLQLGSEFGVKLRIFRDDW